MGALVAVAYLVLHARFAVRPQTLAWLLSGFGFLGVFLLPFAKYPANPPAIGHTFTIVTRGQLYLIMVAASLVMLLGLGVFVAHWLSDRIGRFRATLIAAAGFLVLYGALLAVMPSFGELSANAAHADQFGFAPAATETPHPPRWVGLLRRGGPRSRWTWARSTGRSPGQVRSAWSSSSA